MSSKQSLSLSVQYPDERLKTTLTRPKLRRWVQAATKCQPSSPCALSMPKKAAP